MSEAAGGAWRVPDLQEVQNGQARVSLGDSRVAPEEIAILIGSAGLSVGLILSCFWLGADPWKVGCAVGAALAAFAVVRHLRSGVILDARGITIRSVFRPTVVLRWRSVAVFDIEAGPWPIARTWEAVRLSTTDGSKHWIAQIRRPRPGTALHNRPAGPRRPREWDSVGAAVRELNELAGAL